MFVSLFTMSIAVNGNIRRFRPIGRPSTGSVLGGQIVVWFAARARRTQLAAPIAFATVQFPAPIERWWSVSGSNR